MKKLSLLLFLIILLNIASYAQEDLLTYLEKSDTAVLNQEITGTFKGTRLINGHTIEMVSKKVLNLIISHRFGRINGGPYEFFGLDEANVRIGLDYGFNDNFNIGIGRNSFEKTYDGYMKYKLFQQSSSAMPVTAVLFSSISLNTLQTLPEAIPFSSRISYTWQVLIARKFNSNLSLQIAPVIVHHNLVKEIEQPNDQFALGIGGRYKITKRISINAEYYYRFKRLHQPLNYNSLAFGVDIETGGHVFQLHFTNSRSMIEKGFITETTGEFFKGDIHFGFNISRVFQF